MARASSVRLQVPLLVVESVSLVVPREIMAVKEDGKTSEGSERETRPG